MTATGAEESEMVRKKRSRVDSDRDSNTVKALCFPLCSRWQLVTKRFRPLEPSRLKHLPPVQLVSCRVFARLWLRAELNNYFLVRFPQNTSEDQVNSTPKTDISDTLAYCSLMNREMLTSNKTSRLQRWL